MNRFGLTPMASVTAATLVVNGARSKAANAKLTAGCSMCGRHISLSTASKTSSVASRPSLSKSRSRRVDHPATTPQRLQRDISIKRFVRGHPHEGHCSSRSEGHAGDVLLFRGINDLETGLHAGQHGTRRRDIAVRALRVVEPSLILLQVHDQLRRTSWQDPLERVRARVVLVDPDRFDECIERWLRNTVTRRHSGLCFTPRCRCPGRRPRSPRSPHSPP